MPELKPISVGPLTINAPVILAPMTGVTDLPFRKIVKRYGAGLTVSEMIASQAAIREVTAGEPFGGRCPCCGDAAVLDEHGRLRGADTVHRQLVRWLERLGHRTELPAQDARLGSTA